MNSDKNPKRRHKDEKTAMMVQSWKLLHRTWNRWRKHFRTRKQTSGGRACSDPTPKMLRPLTDQEFSGQHLLVTIFVCILGKAKDYSKSKSVTCPRIKIKRQLANFFEFTVFDSTHLKSLKTDPTTKSWFLPSWLSWVAYFKFENFLGINIFNRESYRSLLPDAFDSDHQTQTSRYSK